MDYEPLTASSQLINTALTALKNACQVNGLRLEELDHFLFGTTYRPEQRITMGDLTRILADKLKLSMQQSISFARFVVE